jgi:hypothetical protein
MGSDNKVERNGKSRLSAFQVHNRRLSEFRMKRSVLKAHRKGREIGSFVVRRLKLAVGRGGGGGQQSLKKYNR